MTEYTLRDQFDSQSIYVCDEHAKDMPAVDGDRVTATPCDSDITCDFCPQPDFGNYEARQMGLTACQ